MFVLRTVRVHDTFVFRKNESLLQLPGFCVARSIVVLLLLVVVVVVACTTIASYYSRTNWRDTIIHIPIYMIET